RFGEGEYRAIDLRAGVVAGDRAARPLLLVLVVARQVAADRRPGLAAVLGFEEDVAGVVDHLGVVRRDQDRGGPLEAVAQVLGAVAGHVVGVGGDVLRQARAAVVARDVAAVLVGEDDVGVGRVRRREAGLAAA